MENLIELGNEISELLDRDDIIEENNEIEEIKIAPKILKLNNNEKLIDENNKIIEIEIRYDNDVYFKVKDIIKEFNLNELNKIITNKKHNGYIENIHYVIFICEELNKIRKVLYLTFLGFHRLINNSKFNYKTKITMLVWLTQFISKINIK